jgi:hypothetical protein
LQSKRTKKAVIRVVCSEWQLSADFVEKVGLRTRFWLASVLDVAVWFGQSPVAPP